MARLIYACLALAAASLVAGFLIRTTSIPLLVSMGLSAVILVLILAGWSRRLRAAGAFDADGGEKVDDLEVVDVEDELGVSAEEVEPVEAATTSVRRRPSRRATRRPAVEASRAGSARPRPRARPDQTIEIPQTPGPKTRPRRRPAKATPKRPARAQPAANATSKPRPKATKPVPSKPKASAARKKAPARGRSASRTKPGPTAKTTGRVLVIPGRSRFHAAGCRFARGDDVREVTEAVARRRGYEPCTVCMPGAA